MKRYLLFALYCLSSGCMSLKNNSNNPALSSSQILYQKALIDVENLRRQRTVQPPKSPLMEVPNFAPAPVRVEESNENEVAFVVCGIPLCKLFRVLTRNYNVETPAPDTSSWVEKNY